LVVVFVVSSEYFRKRNQRKHLAAIEAGLDNEPPRQNGEDLEEVPA
jgi:hypothetical protein